MGEKEERGNNSLSKTGMSDRGGGEPDWGGMCQKRMKTTFISCAVLRRALLCLPLTEIAGGKDLNGVGVIKSQVLNQRCLGLEQSAVSTQAEVNQGEVNNKVTETERERERDPWRQLKRTATSAQTSSRIRYLFLINLCTLAPSSLLVPPKGIRQPRPSMHISDRGRSQRRRARHSQSRQADSGWVKLVPLQLRGARLGKGVGGVEVEQGYFFGTDFSSRLMQDAM